MGLSSAEAASPDCLNPCGRTKSLAAPGVPCGDHGGRNEKGTQMAAMKPRTGDGPMEVTKEGRSLIMRVPIDGGGRLVLELNKDEANALRECLVGVTDA